MYCCKVVVAHPDYKRPYAEVIVKHFNDKMSADTYVNEVKKEYIEEFHIDKAIAEVATCHEDEDELITLQELDTIIRNGRLDDIIYAECYMDQPAFEWEITPIVAED